MKRERTDPTNTEIARPKDRGRNSETMGHTHLATESERQTHRVKENNHKICNFNTSIKVRPKYDGGS